MFIFFFFFLVVKQNKINKLNEEITFPCSISDLPRNTKLSITIWSKKIINQLIEGKPYILATNSVAIFDDE